MLYILDELHVYFPARQAMQKHPLNWVFQYGTQHGHFSDTIFAITQSLSYVDKIFREWTQDYIYLENERLVKVRGFRKGNGMVARFYQFPPTLGTEEPNELENLPLDTEGYGKLYDTSGGAGIAGGGNADKGTKVKGLPLWSVWGIAAGVFLLLVGALFTAKYFLNRAVFGDEKKPAAVAKVQAFSEPQKAGRPVVQNVGGSAKTDTTGTTVRTGQDDPPAVAQAVTWTRLIQRGPKTFVYLSDGRVIATPAQVQYDGAGLVDVVDLEGRHWRISRAPMAWGSNGGNQVEVKK